MTDIFLFHLLAPAVLAWAFVASRLWYWPKIVYYLLKDRTATRAEANAKRFKPFDCEMCMGFWVGLIWNVADFSLITLIVYACTTSLLTCLLTKYAKSI